MKLFLCSMGLKNQRALEHLIGQPLDNIKCGVIKNPTDLKPKKKRKYFYELIDNGFQAFGINKTDIDLREYENRPNELKKLINKLDMLWITGGNIFYLRELIEKIKMKNILIKAIEKGLVYGGDSAGALITCPTLKYLDLVDDTSEIEEVIYEGLGLIDFVPLPHWDNGKFKPKLIEIKEKLEKDGYEVMVYGDDQTIIVNEENIKIVGEIDKNP